MIKVKLIEDKVVKETTNFNYEKKRDEIIKEINSNPIIWDYAYKVKTKQEKELLHKLKTAYKLNTQNNK